MDRIYLDASATTPLLPEVWDAMRPHALAPGNAASSHAFGRGARRALESAREEIAQLLDAAADQVIFTSGATEANNLAIFGLAGEGRTELVPFEDEAEERNKFRSTFGPPGTIVSSPLEHPCVVEPIEQLRKHGFTGLSLTADVDGRVVGAASWPADVRLACVMLSNHETGVVQPVQALASELPAAARFHCDAAAAAGKIPISFRQLGVASLTISAHKFHGPQGIGALVLRRGLKLKPALFGGHQQAGLRPGTEPVALAVGMATALRWCSHRYEENRLAVQRLRSRFLERLRGDAAPISVQGAAEQEIPHVLNVAFPGCRADALLMNLDLAGIACSTGSACSSGSLLPSPVLRAMGVSEAVLGSAMRFSFSTFTTVQVIDEAAGRVVQAVARLRR